MHVNGLAQGYYPPDGMPGAGLSASDAEALVKKTDRINAITARAQIAAPGIDAATVEGLLDLYDEAVKYGLPAFVQGAQWMPTLQHLEDFSGKPRATVVAFLVAMREIDSGVSFDETFMERLKDAGTAILQAPADLINLALAPVGGGEKVLKYVAWTVGGLAAVWIGSKIFSTLKS